MVTVLSTVLLFPVLWLLGRHHFVLAALLVLIHDLADRLDGSLARSRAPQASRYPAHDSRLGAFLDAQGDKVFHIGFLLYNLVWSSSSLSLAYVLVAWAVIAAQSVSFVVRCLDFFLPVSGPGGNDLRAGGEGKLATTLCNAAALTACLAAGSRAAGGGAWGALSVLLLLGSLDLALRSVKSKLLLRVWRDDKKPPASETPVGANKEKRKSGEEI